MIFTAIMVFFTGENIVERLASGSRLISTSTTPKMFLYLVMAEKCLPVHMRGASNIGNASTCNCDIIMFGYKAKCDEAKNGNLEHVEYIHRSDTTWNTGRNYLYEHAMKRETAYLYYIFVDGDASLRPNADTNVNVTSLGLWRSFENFLVEYEPAVGITTYCHSINQPCFKQRNKPGGDGVYVLSGYLFDACFNAFHHDALPFPTLSVGNQISQFTKFINKEAFYIYIVSYIFLQCLRSVVVLNMYDISLLDCYLQWKLAIASPSFAYANKAQCTHDIVLGFWL